MLGNNRDEDVCPKWDDLAEQDHTYRMTESEYFHYRQNWWISLKKPGNATEPMRKRSDLNQALSTLNRLHREAGGKQLWPTPCWKYQQRKPASSSSSTWWQWSESWWSSQEFKEGQKRGCVQRFTIERSDPLFTDLCRKPQTNGFHEFILISYG